LLWCPSIRFTAVWFSSDACFDFVRKGFTVLGEVLRRILSRDII